MLLDLPSILNSRIITGRETWVSAFVGIGKNPEMKREIRDLRNLAMSVSCFPPREHLTLFVYYLPRLSTMSLQGGESPGFIVILSVEGLLVANRMPGKLMLFCE
jgi:hypothetical protein